MARVNYHLAPDEALIVKSESVTYVEGLKRTACELVLTNKNIILIKKGMMGKAKDVNYFPVAGIKTYNGQAQALFSQSFGTAPKLEVNFIDGIVAVEFLSKKEALNWVNKINILLTGNPADDSQSISGAPLTGALEPLADAVGGIKQMLGLKSKSVQSDSPSGAIRPRQQVVAYCTSCGASISGLESSAVKCEYCGNEQMLPVRAVSTQATPAMTTPDHVSGQILPTATPQPIVEPQNQDPLSGKAKGKGFGKRVARAGADVAKDVVKDAIADKLNPLNWL